MEPAPIPAVVLLSLLPFAAAADVGEASIRPYGEARRGDVEGSAVTSFGGGAVLGYGLSFPLTATLRYGLDASPTVTDASRRTARETREVRHALLAGVAWAPSDELTPVLSVEAGAVLRHVSRADFRVDETGARFPEDEGAALEPAPAARASAAIEWRFADFFGLGGGAFAEHAGGFGYGGWLAVTAYRYL